MRFLEWCRDYLNSGLKKRSLEEKFPEVSFGKGVQVIGLNSVAIGRGSCISDDVWVNDCIRDGVPRLMIGETVLVGRRGVISTAGHLEIGSFTILAPDVIVTDADHVYENPMLPYLQQGATSGRTLIVEENCWLGLQVKVLGDLTIGRGSVVAAGSLVRNSLPPFVVAAGSPARIVKFYDFKTQTWRKVQSVEQSEQLANGVFERGKIPERGEYLQLLAQKAAFRNLDPILAGGGISI